MKAHLLLSIALCSGIMASAETLTPQQALDRAAVAAKAMHKAKGIESAAPQLRLTVNAVSQAACYVFGYADGNGYLVLAADDAAPAVLGYSDTGTIDPEAMPPALNYWLQQYADEIEYARSIGLAPMKEKARGEEREAIAPLVKTKWNQSTPYNLKCPMYNGERSVTGCVATALAQVMKYHAYPEKGKGSISYQSNGTTVTCNFGETTYDWANMLNEYGSNATQQQKDAVANLMFSCGASVKMEYTSSESGAASILVPAALVTYFGYDKAVRYAPRNYYALDEWQDLIYDQLKNYGPVQYSGESSDGGHSFVCDGYSQDGYFHINWGWGGMSDGYFLLTALDPETQGIGGSSSGYNYEQDVICNVSKPREGSKMCEQLFFEGNFDITTSNVYLGSTASVTGPVYNFSIDKISGMLGFKFDDGNGNVVYAQGQEYENMPSLSGLNKYTVTIPTSLGNGTYTVTPVFRNSEGVWSECMVPISSVRAYTAVVANGQVTFTAVAAPTVTFTNVNTNVTPYYVGSKFKVTATITNNSSEEFYDAFVAAIVDEYDNLVAYGDAYPIDLMPGESIDVAYVSAFSHVPSEESGSSSSASSIEPGEYTMFFVTSDLSTALTNGYQITLNEAPENTQIAVGNVQLVEGGNVVADPSKMKVTAEVQCESGYFASSLILAIFPYSEGSVSSVGMLESPAVFLSAGDTQTVTFSGSFDGGEVGKKYMAFVFNGQTQESEEPLVFTIADPSGITSVVVDDGSDASPYFNIQGVAVDRLVPGIYIHNGRKVIIR